MFHSDCVPNATANITCQNPHCQAGFNLWNSVWNDNGGSDRFLYKDYVGSDTTFESQLGSTKQAPGNFAAVLKNKAQWHAAGSPPSQMDEGGDIYNSMVASGDFCHPSAHLYTELFIKYGIDVHVYTSNADPLLGPPTTWAGIQAAFEAAGNEDAWTKWNGTASKKIKNKFNDH